jgi:hypothetical protein
MRTTNSEATRRGARPSTSLLLFILLAVMAGSPARAENIDPAGDGSQYGWGENVGWINAEPSGDAGPGVAVEDFRLTGWMWSEHDGWISLSCENTGSCGTTPYGVKNDGSGHLSGYAWAENAGWIHFKPTNGGVTVDPATGNFSGRAWGEQTGWITFAAAAPVPYKVKTAWCQNVASPPAGSTRPDSRQGGERLLAQLVGAGRLRLVRRRPR